jgi:hypothetical protein
MSVERMDWEVRRIYSGHALDMSHNPCWHLFMVKQTVLEICLPVNLFLLSTIQFLVLATYTVAKGIAFQVWKHRDAPSEPNHIVR